MSKVARPPIAPSHVPGGWGNLQSAICNLQFAIRNSQFAIRNSEWGPEVGYTPPHDGT